MASQKKPTPKTLILNGVAFSVTERDYNIITQYLSTQEKKEKGKVSVAN